MRQCGEAVCVRQCGEAVVGEPVISEAVRQWLDCLCSAASVAAVEMLKASDSCLIVSTRYTRSCVIHTLRHSIHTLRHSIHSSLCLPPSAWPRLELPPRPPRQYRLCRPLGLLLSASWLAARAQVCPIRVRGGGLRDGLIYLVAVPKALSWVTAIWENTVIKPLAATPWAS